LAIRGLLHPALTLQLIEQSGAPPGSFVVDEIMVPVVECWAAVAGRCGVLLESHAQNTLLEVDEEYRPRRIVHRDFDVWIDTDARRRAGLPVPFIDAEPPPSSHAPIEQHYSLIYDRFIGEEFFEYVVKLLEQAYNVRPSQIRARVGEAFHRAFPGATQVFPPNTTFYFSDASSSGHDFTLVDTHQRPRWR